MTSPFKRGNKPTTTASNIVGNENGQIALTLSSQAFFAGDSLTYTFNGLPAGAQLSAGTYNADGSWTVTQAELAHLTIAPPSGFVGVMNLNVTTTETTPDGYQATASTIFSVTVTPVAFVPSLTVADASGVPGGAIALSISAAQAHDYLANGNLSITVAGLNGATLNHGHANGDGSYTLTLEDLSGLTLTPASGFGGTLALSVTATDREAPSNTVQSTTPQTLHVLVKTVTPPALAIDTVDGNGFINKANVAAGIAITGSVQDVGSLAGRPITIILNGKSYTGTIGQNGKWSVAVGAADLAALTDGATYQINASGSDGSGTGISATASVVVDKQAGLAISPISGDGFLNHAESATALTISGKAGDSITANIIGQIVRVSFAGKNYTAIVQADGSWSTSVAAADVAALADGSAYTATATITDKAGNTVSTTARVQTVETAAVTIDQIATDGIINGAEAGSGIYITGKATGSIASAVTGALVTVRLGAKAYTGTVQADGSWKVIVYRNDIALLADATTFTVSAQLTDKVGNSAFTARSVTTDKVIGIAINPVPALINGATAGSGFTITGRVADSIMSNVVGQPVTVTIGDQSVKATVAANGTWSAKVDASIIAALTDGATYTIVADVTDTAGNHTSKTVSTTLDERLTLSIDPVDGSGAVGSLTITGRADDSVPGNVAGRTVTLTLNGATYTGTIARDGSWAIDVGADAVAKLADGTSYTIVAKASDAAGNQDSRSTSLLVNRTLPAVALDLQHDSGASSTDGYTNDPTIVATAAASAGLASVLVSIDGGKAQDITASLDSSGHVTLSQALLTSLAGGTLADGKHAVTISATDTKGHTTSRDLAFVLDTTAPFVDSLGLTSTDQASSDPTRTTKDSVTIEGITSPGAIVTIDGTTRSTTADAKTGAFSFDKIAVLPGAQDVTIDTLDLAGNSSSETLTVSRETLAVTASSQSTKLNPGGINTISYQLTSKGLQDLDGNVVVTLYLVADGKTLADGIKVASVALPASTLGSSGTYAADLKVPAAALTGLPFAHYTGIVTAAVQVGDAPADLTTASSGLTFDLGAAYSAHLTVNGTTLLDGGSIALAGVATGASSGSTVAFVPVLLTITSGSHVQTMTVTTDASGAFSTVFKPLAGAIGQYDVTASNPTNPKEDSKPEATFEVVGLNFEQSSVTQALTVDQKTTGTIVIDNPSAIALDSTSYAVTGLPEGWTFALTDLPTSLAAGSQTVLHYELTATTKATTAANFSLKVGSASGASATTSFAVTALTTAPDIVIDSSALDVSILPGQQTQIVFTITNKGQDTATNLRLALPAALTWLSSASAENIGDLAGGASKQVTLLLNPASNTTLGDYTGTIGLQYGSPDGANHGLTAGFDFNVTTNQTGALHLKLVDEGTLLLPNAPALTGAKVIIMDSTGKVVDTEDNVSGGLDLSSLKVGNYTVRVTADGHDSYNGSFAIKSNKATAITAFLPIDAVQYKWTVVKSNVSDDYKIVLDATFQTDVPKPVITADPPILDLKGMAVGDTKTIQVTLTNHGLIAAKDVAINLPEPNGYVLTPLVNSLPEIAANSSVTIPVTAVRVSEGAPVAFADNLSVQSFAKTASASALKTLAAGYCGTYGVIFATIYYDFICPPYVEHGSLTLGVNIDYGSGAPCVTVSNGGVSATISGGDGGGGGGGDGGGATVSFPYSAPAASNTGGWCYTIITGVSFAKLASNIAAAAAGDPAHTEYSSEDERLSVADLFQSDLVQNLANLVPVTDTIYNGSGALAVKSALNAVGTPDAAHLQASLASQLTTLQSDIDTLAKAHPEGLDYGELFGSAAAAGLASESDPATFLAQLADLYSYDVKSDPSQNVDLTNAAALEQALRPLLGTRFQGTASVADYVALAKAQYAYRAYLVGDARLFDTSDKAGLDSFLTFVSKAFTAGTQISASSVPVPQGVDSAAVAEFVSRFNRTLTYWNAGIYNASQVPTGQSSDFVALDTLQSLYSAFGGSLSATDAQTQALLDNNSALTVDVLEAKTQYQIEQIKQVTGACATVKVEVDQSAILSRTAFEGSLTIDANKDFKGIGFELVITDANGNVVDPSTFGVTMTSLTGVSALDGSEAVADGTEINVAYTFIPSLAAALNGPTNYNIGGKFTMFYDGGSNTTTLAPVTVTVLPQPVLDLDYFWQRNVIADDPFTADVVEPSQPFVLGVQVHNSGAGDATDLTIESAQPKIVDNAKGLAVDFKIIGSSVQGSPSDGTLTAKFGTVSAGTTSTGEWQLVSSIQGKFIDYSASFQNISALGRTEDSIIQAVNIHELIHAGDVDGDGVDDFLANDIPDINSAPDELYFSDGTKAKVFGLATTATATAPADDTLVLTISTAGKEAEWDYFDQLISGSSDYSIASVTRADGSALNAGQYWFTDRTFLNSQTNPVKEDRVHIVDNAASSSYTVTLKHAPTPTAADITIGLLTDTGASPTDKITSNARIGGAGAAKAVVHFTVDGTAIADTAVADDSGHWTYMPTGLSEGQHTIVASETDALLTSGSASLTFTYLSKAPTVTVALAHDTGSSATDNSTSDATLTGTGAAGSTVTILLDGKTNGTTVVQSDGTWSFLPKGVTLGAHKVVAEDSDTAGNTGLAALDFTLVNATTPALTLGLVKDTGSSAFDDVTSDPRLTGVGAAGVNVSFTIDGNAVTGHVTADANGVYTLSPQGLGDGSHVVVAKATDASGGDAGQASYTFTLDTTAPALSLGLVNDTGKSSSDRLTNDARISGVTEAAATVTYTVDGVAVNGQTTTGGNGAFSFAPQGLSDGQHVIVAKSTDAAGNAKTASLTFTLDTVPPTISAALLHDTGSSASDGITDDATITGQTTAGATVTVISGGQTLGQVSADSSGKYQFAPQGLAQGAHTLTVQTADDAGNIGQASVSFTLTSATPVITLALANDTGASASDGLTSDATITGHGLANATATITVDGAAAGTATADATGLFTIKPQGLAEGAHKVVVTETNAAGSSGQATLNFTLDTKAPVVGLSLTNDTGTSTSDTLTSDARITGTTEAGAVVTFTIDGVVVSGYTVAGSNGAFSFSPSGLTDGKHVIGAQATDTAGNKGSSSLTLTLDTVAPTITAALAHDTGNSAIDKLTSDPTISGQTTAGATVTVKSGSQTLGQTQADGTGKYQYTAQGLADGAVTLTVQTADAAGNVGQATTAFTLDATAPALTSANVYAGAVRDPSFTTLVFDFADVLDPATVTASNFALKGPGGATIAPQKIQILNNGKEVSVAYAAWSQQGSYELDLNLGAIRNNAGVAAGAGVQAIPFTIAGFTNRFINQAGGKWTLATNWSAGTVPTASDEVLIDLQPGNTAVVDTGDQVASGIVASSGGGLSITGGTLTTGGLQSDGVVSITGGTLSIGGAGGILKDYSQTGGALAGTGTVKISGTASFANGYYNLQTGTGTTDFKGTTTFGTSTGYTYLALDGGRTLQNDGTFNWSTTYSSLIYMGYNPYATTLGSSTIVNSAGATFDLQSDSLNIYNQSGTNLITNAGTFKKSGGTGTDTINVPLNNSGTIEVDSGILNLSGGGTWTGGTVKVADAGTLQFGGGAFGLTNTAFTLGNGKLLVTGGTVTVSGSTLAIAGTLVMNGGTLDLSGETISSIATLDLTNGTLALGANNVTVASLIHSSSGSAALSGTGKVTITGATNLANGYYTLQTGTGTTVLKGTTSFANASNYSYLALDGGRVLQNDGTFTWNTAYSSLIYMGYNPFGTTLGSSTIVNSAGATFDLQSDSLNIYNQSGTNLITNAGTFKKSGGTGTDTINVAINNSGTIQVDSGNLTLSGGGTWTGGTVKVADAGTLQFAGGTLGITNAAFALGNGKLLVSNGTVTVSGSTVAVAGILSVTGGTIDLSGATISSIATLDLTGGTLALGGNNVTVTTLTHSTSNGGALSGTGKVTITGAADLANGYYNLQTGTGTTNLKGATSFVNVNSYGYLALDGGRTLQNDGTFSWSTNYSSLIYMGYNPYAATLGSSTIVNSVGATFDLQSDSLNIYNYSGTNLFTNAGLLKKSGGTGTDTIGVAINNSGTVEVDSGTFSLSGGGAWTGGSVKVADTATLLFSGGTTTIKNAAFTLGKGTLAVSSGTVTVSGSTLAIAGTLSMTGGTLDLSGETISSIATLDLNGGTLNLGANNVTVASLTHSTSGSGILSGTGKVTVTGSAQLANSYYNLQTGSGTTDLKGTTSFASSNGYGYLALDGGRTLQNDGTFNWSTTYNSIIYMGYNPYGTTLGSSTILNSVGATFDIQSDSLNIYNYTGTNLFTNAGLLKKSGGTGSDSIGVTLNNSGTVEVDSGTLNLGGGGTWGGIAKVADAATLQFSNGTFSLTNTSFTLGKGTLAVSGGSVTVSGSTLAIAGTLSMTGGTLDLSGETISSIATLDLTGGGLALGANNVTVTTLTHSNSGGASLSGTGKVTITGAAVLTNGSYSAETGTGTTDLKGTTSFSSSSNYGYLALDGGRTLQNDGTLVFNTTYGSVLYLGYNPYGTTLGSATLVNSVGATIDIQSDNLQIYNYTGTNLFNNAGLLKKSAGTGTDTISVAITNSGTVEVDSGTLSLTGGITNTGSLLVKGGDLSISGTISGSGTATIASGTLELLTASSQNVTFSGTTGLLKLSQSQNYTGTITGLTHDAGTEIDLGDIGFNANTKATYSGNATGGTLTVTDGSHVAAIKLLGDYTSSSWVLASDSHGGTLLHDPLVSSSSAHSLQLLAQNMSSSFDQGSCGLSGIEPVPQNPALTPALAAAH